MNVIIVGHGPSILKEEMGGLIDGYDVVIRMKPTARATLEHPAHYGQKTSVMASSLNTITKTKGVGGARHYWGLWDSRHYDTHPYSLPEYPERLAEWFAPHKVRHDRELSKRIDNYYLRVLTRLEDEGSGHPHSSQGFKAVGHAMAWLRPDRLALVGFDNIFTGDRTWSVTRGPDYDRYPNHHWKAEHIALDEMSDDMGVPVTFILPNEFGATDTVQ